MCFSFDMDYQFKKNQKQNTEKKLLGWGKSDKSVVLQCMSGL